MDPADLFDSRTPWLLATGAVCFGAILAVMIAAMLLDLWRWRSECSGRRARSIAGCIFGAFSLLAVYGVGSYYVTVALAKQLLFVWN